MNNQDKLVESLVRKMQEAEQDVSSYKQRFIDYCKGKISDLGIVNDMSEEDIEDNSLEDEYLRKVCFIEPEFRGDKDVRVIRDEDGGCICVNQNGEIIFNGGQMWATPNQMMEFTFSRIDQDFYNEMLEYWDEYYFDDIMELDDVVKSSKEKIEKELKVPEPFKYNVISRNGGADVEVYCPEIQNLQAKTTTMKSGEYVQDWFDIDGLWQVNIVDEDGGWDRYEYITGWQDAMNLLKQQYDNLKSK